MAVRPSPIVLQADGSPILYGLSARQIADVLHDSKLWEQRFVAYQSEKLGRILIWMYNINTKECQYIAIQMDPQSIKELDMSVPQMAITTNSHEFSQLIASYWPGEKYTQRVKALIEFDECGKDARSPEN
jgi:hypothetical protein